MNWRGARGHEKFIQSGSNKQGADRRDFPTEIRNSNFFPAENRSFPPKKKKRSSSQKCHEIRCQSTKLSKIPVASTNLGLDLHSSSPKLVNFFGAQSSLGGAQFSFGGAQAVIWGGTAQECLPWCRDWAKGALALPKPSHLEDLLHNTSV